MYEKDFQKLYHLVAEKVSTKEIESADLKWSEFGKLMVDYLGWQ